MPADVGRRSSADDQEPPDETAAFRYVVRRQVSRREYEFVDDQDRVLGVMRRSRFSLNGTTTTERGTYRSVGSGFNHRMEDCGTGERVVGKGVGWRLPDGEALSSRLSRGRVVDRTFDLCDSERTVVIQLSWLPPVAPWRGSFPHGKAELALELQPNIELVPLLSYAFQWFASMCQPRTLGATG